MKVRHILKAVACLLAMPSMLLTTACSSDDVQNNEQAPEAFRGYVRHVTINATRGDNDVTRAFYNGKNLLFSEGDQIFFGGDDGVAGRYAMLVDYKSASTFEGDLYTQNEYTGSLSNLLTSGCNDRNYADFIPAGYEAFGHITITNKDTYYMNVSHDTRRTFAPTKKIAIEQFFGEFAGHYDATDGFQFEAHNGVIGFTLNGLEPLTTYNFTFRSVTGGKPFDISGTSTTDKDGTATFAVGTTTSSIYTRYYIIIDDGGKYMDIDLGNKAIKANHIVTVAPLSVTAKTVVNLASLPSGTYAAAHGLILEGTAPAGVDVQIQDGAGVVLRNAVINDGISCVGDATIILEGESTVQNGIKAGPSGKTLTIKGNGQLTVTGAANCAAIGTGYGTTCGDITISSGTIIATGGTDAAAIGTGNGGTCGNITIEGGSVDATGTGYGAAIGTGYNGECGKITISQDVTGIFARSGLTAPNSIGKGSEGSTIGKVNIGGFTGAKTESPYVYPETHVDTWTFYDVSSFNLAAGKDYRGLVVGCTLRSNGLSGGTVVAGHMSGSFQFIAPYNRKFTTINIKGSKCNSVSMSGWLKTLSGMGAEWNPSGALEPAHTVYITCDIENVEKIVLTFQ